MSKNSLAMGIEIKPQLVGALFTDKIGETLRVFCYYTNGEISQFDVPEDDNRESLRSLLATLNTDDTCTSLIQDEVVQGRVYVKTDKEHWLYTMLRSPGQIPPPLNADIADLPWEVCWRSHEAEVLRYTRAEGPERCIAIRTHISENDASRLVQSSKAFTRPASVPQKQPQRRDNAYVGPALFVLGLLMCVTLFFTVKQSRVVVSAPAPAIQAKKVEPEVRGGYYLLYNHKISGPYPAKVVADMSASGLFNDETMCRPENTTEWGKLAAAFPRVAQN